MKREYIKKEIHGEREIFRFERGEKILREKDIEKKDIERETLRNEDIKNGRY